MSTPLMQQYDSIKKQYNDYLLLFRLGDFYELFNDDAKKVSDLLGLVLTKRGEIPMSGIPASSLDFYLNKLVYEHNQKLALCEQMETPEQAKLEKRNLVRREVVKIITKGTYINESFVQNNFILTIKKLETYYLLCYCDFSTGECFFESCEENLLISEIYKISPVEILLSEYMNNLEIFEDIIILKKFKELKVVDHNLDKNEIEALSDLINYGSYCGLQFIPNIMKRNSNFYIKISKQTIMNLEILNNMDGSKENSLLNILNRTTTAMGRRILHSFLLRPLKHQKSIEDRLDCVEYFVKNPGSMIKIADVSKIVNNIKNLDDIVRLSQNIEKVFNYIKTLKNLPFLLKNLYKEIQNIKIYTLVLKNLHQSENILKIKNDDILALEIEKDSILQEMDIFVLNHVKDGKIKNNNLIGYFIEVKNKNKLGEHFLLKQGLAGVSRYTCKELIKMEKYLYDVERQITTIEESLFQYFKEEIHKEKTQIEKLSHLFALMDYFHSCAQAAIENRYYRPKFHEEHKLEITEMRHPVIEKLKKVFVYNDLFMDTENRVFLITGPNMGGKSTYLRQAALNILMAQVGMFVPSHMKTPIFDSLFVRIGSGDNITENQSTFMNEMNECGEMLNLATNKSFLVVDEIGRGTSVQDGIAISQAICEYIHNEIQCFAMISTHYYQLTDCTNYLKYFKNKKTKILSSNNRINFLYKIVDGIADSSLGLFIAQMAKLPKKIINRSIELFNKK